MEDVAYGADTRLFVVMGGYAVLVYGAVDIGWTHCADEHVSASELLTAMENVACLLADRCGVAL